MGLTVVEWFGVNEDMNAKVGEENWDYGESDG